MQEITTERQRELLNDVAQLAEQCVNAERALQDEQSARQAALVKAFRERRDELTKTFEAEVSALRSEFKRRREDSIYRHDSGIYNVVQEQEKFLETEDAKHEKALNRSKATFQITKQHALDDYEANKNRPAKDAKNFTAACESSRGELTKLLEQAAKTLRRRQCAFPGDEIEAETIPAAGALERFKTEYGKARESLRTLERQPAAKFLEDGWPFLIFLFGTLAAVYPVYLLSDWVIAVAGSLLFGLLAAVAVRQLVWPVARRQSLSVMPDFVQAIANGEEALDVAIADAVAEAKRKETELLDRRDRTVNEAQMLWSRQKVELAEEHQRKIEAAKVDFAGRRQKIKEKHEAELQEFDAKFPAEITAREQQFARDSEDLNNERQQALNTFRDEFDKKWQTLSDQWNHGFGQFKLAIDEMQAFCEQRFPQWDAVDWQQWQPTYEDLPMLRFGQLNVDLAELPSGLPSNERLALAQTEYQMPEVLTYPDFPSLLYKADGIGRDFAIASQQNVMLRLLTSLPPGKVRFTIIDPTGLGQNFSAFMHLADFDERLVSNRIWTESTHINKRLADLTEHMENVIQKYLRNEFDSIQEYNRHAGEVAEAYQILVIANFPANFTEDAARRLVSIASSGARCGVYTLLSCDTKMKFPRNFELADLEKHSVVLDWQGESFCRQSEGLEHLPLLLDGPPTGELLTQVVRAVGEFAKDANRVEVPFESVLPPDDEWWTRDSRGDVVVPLGRAGATKLQSMELGKGTSQHVLISGKTGSGKSTLLHAMITNLSAYYSPREIHFYLIDFKKGVEFKAYAACGLPHARVIAIESEREFGMSVLERLDQELKRRGDLFREHGVQDVKGYRDANPDADMPRILLIIDEFQEFFVKDDKIASDAGLLLDRLVRQGRAFGIHVLLGSQTLAGAYSLARSTLGQMAVRIALQCSEADAHLILSDDNTAARLLNRPGEAIYNDANGLFEGNHPFQVVWLSDEQRERYLKQATSMAKAREICLPAPIVFEGNVAADPSENSLLRAALQSAPAAGAHAVPRAWLGAAVAIKDPAVAEFRRQSGANLMIVGQHEDMALGTLSNAVISLTSQFSVEELAGERYAVDETAVGRLYPFFVLDGERKESSNAGFWNYLASQLPLDMEVVTPRGAAETVRNIAAEVERRMEASDDTASPIYLVIHNLSRFRDLRKSDDFGFSFDDDAPAGADKQLATILREGPNFGVHALVWCDNFNNVNRWLDRQSIGDFGYRVLFQMSATDSANMMDSPEASRLGVHRAILYNEEQGEFEKFRPYGLPSDEWLAWVKQQLADRFADMQVV